MRRKLAAVFALVMLLTGCALMQQDLVAPDVQLVSIAPSRISVTSLRLVCVLEVYNPNSVSIPIQNAQFDLNVEGLELASSRLPEAFDIGPQSSELVEIIVDVDSIKSLSLLLSVMQSGQQTFDYELNGYVDVGISYLGRVRIDEAGSVDIGKYMGTGRR